MAEFWMRYVARALALTWACWWIYFALASGLGEPDGWFHLLIQLPIAVILFLGGTFVAWRWERVGGILLLTEGLALFALCVLYLQGRYIVFLLLTLALPPILAGALFLLQSFPWRFAPPSSPAP